MLHGYSNSSTSQEVKLAPETSVINAILNYSKSLEVKKVKKKRILIHLN